MMNKRQFLAGSLSFAGSASLLSALGNSKAFAADMTGYKALVCVFLFGGQDGHDTILPYDQASYDVYAGHRSGLLAAYAAQDGGSSRARDRLRKLSPVNEAAFNGRQFALPEALDPIKSLFDNGNAAILGNVGPLIQPLTKTDYDGGITPRPKRLFSHNDQQSTWMSSAPEGETLGWGGRLADTFSGQDRTFSAVSTFGNTVFLSGQSTIPYSIGTNGPASVDRITRGGNNGLLGQASGDEASVQRLMDQYRDLGAVRSNLLERDMGAIANKAYTSNAAYSAAAAAAPDLQTVFPNNFLGRQLRTVAETISLRSQLNMSRQVFFVGLGGFDTHDGQVVDLTARQTLYAQGIAAFFAATQEMGLTNDVTLFTGSDFGRSLVENGNGTDHGWGSHHFIVGGAVNGNQIYGDIPPYDMGHDYDAGNGRLIPNVAVEQYAATLGKWFGLTNAELAAALPALANFTEKDLGFMGAV